MEGVGGPPPPDMYIEEDTMDDSNCLAAARNTAKQLEPLAAEDRVILFMRDHDKITDTIKNEHSELIDKLLEHVTNVFEGSERAGGAQDGVVDKMDEDNDDGKIPWEPIHAEMVTYWHYYIKKSLEILLYTIGVSYPGLLKSICAAGASSTFGYIDAVFLCCLYSLIGCVGGAAVSWSGTIGITLATYSVLKPLIEQYASTNTNSEYIRGRAIDCTQRIDTGIISNTREAWDATKGLIPDILKYPGIGIDRASSLLADVMVTRIMFRTYNFGSSGIAGVKIPSHSGGEVDLLDKYGLLNLEILYSGEELTRKTESRLAILSLKTLTGHIFKIIDDERVSILARQNIPVLDPDPDVEDIGGEDEGELVRQVSNETLSNDNGTLSRTWSESGKLGALKRQVEKAKEELEAMKVLLPSSADGAAGVAHPSAETRSPGFTQAPPPLPPRDPDYGVEGSQSNGQGYGQSAPDDSGSYGRAPGRSNRIGRESTLGALRHSPYGRGYGP